MSDKDVARAQGTRVWNQWSSDDPEAQAAAEAAEAMAEAEQDDAGLAELRALNPKDEPGPDETPPTPAPKPKRQSKPKNR
jgi:hypothetical protein